MTFLLFIFYCIVFCWLITRIRFFKESGLSNKFLVALFVVRIFSLIAGCYVNLHLLRVSDSVQYHQMGLEEFHLLFQNPHEYFFNLFHSDYPSGYSRFLDDSKSYWNNLRENLVAKMLSVFNLFSLKSFWIDTLFFNFLVFFGNVALYKVFIRIFPSARLQLIICIFLLPSALFFSSMIRKDGLVFLSFCMLLYNLFFIIKNQLSIKTLLGSLFFLLCILFLRNFVFIVLLPAILAWVLAEKYPDKSLLIFLSVYTFSILIFFSSNFISPRANLPAYVSQRQKSFIELGKDASSTIAIDSLAPNWKSFLKNAPQALEHVLLRPYLWESSDLQYLPFALEMLFIEVLFVIFLLYHKRKQMIEPVIYFCVFFSMTMLLITGYVVPIIGAIVRYRSTYLVFLLIPLLCYMEWGRIKTLLFRKQHV